MRKAQSQQSIETHLRLWRFRTGTRGQVVVMGVVKVKVEGEGCDGVVALICPWKKIQAAEHTSGIELMTPVLANCTAYSRVAGKAGKELSQSQVRLQRPL